MLWFWGLAGAFIYAGPKWVICLSATKDSAHNVAICTIEAVVSLAVGTLAAVVFSPLADQALLTTLHLRDDNAVCACIGLFANRLAPELVEKGAFAFSTGATVVGRVLKALKGDEK